MLNRLYKCLGSVIINTIKQSLKLCQAIQIIVLLLMKHGRPLLRKSAFLKNLLLVLVPHAGRIQKSDVFVMASIKLSALAYG